MDMVTYTELTIDMYEPLALGWTLLPEKSTGIGDDKISIAKYLARNKGCSFAAFHNDKLIGAVLSGHDGRRAFLNHLFVLPEYRNKGIAGKLVSLAFDKLKKDGIERAGVFIHKSNEIAQKFWAKTGFQKVDFIETYGINIR
jgi:ribosomal protein S18 acetylase RimI-like enzyme